MTLRGHNAAAVPIEPTIKFLIAVCGPCMLAFPAGWIRGILTPKEAGSGPAVPSAGVMYPRTNLADRLGLPESLRSPDTRLILYGNGTCTCAFTVDRVIELIDSDRRDLRPLPAHFKAAERARLSGLLLSEETVVLIVNPLWLLETNTRIDGFQSGMARRQNDLYASVRDAAIAIPDMERSIEQAS